LNLKSSPVLSEMDTVTARRRKNTGQDQSVQFWEHQAKARRSRSNPIIRL